jgi:hypothetical protein
MEPRWQIGTHEAEWSTSEIFVRREAFIRHSGKCVDVTRCARLAVKLLARHVPRRAEHLIFDGYGLISSRSSKTEVSKEGGTVMVEKDVCRFYIAVEDALAVRGVERACHLGEDAHSQFLIEPGIDPLFERAPVYESH